MNDNGRMHCREGIVMWWRFVILGYLFCHARQTWQCGKCVIRCILVRHLSL